MISKCDKEQTCGQEKQMICCNSGSFLKHNQMSFPHLLKTAYTLERLSHWKCKLWALTETGANTDLYCEFQCLHNRVVKCDATFFDF